MKMLMNSFKAALVVLALTVGSHHALADEASAPAASTPAAATPATPAAATPAAAPAAAPAPTAPFLTDFSKINSGDTAWMLTSTALVLFMTIPGLALFYGGMVRKKNVLATLMQSFAITCLITVLWVVIGYSLAFMPGSGWLGNLDRFMLHGMLYQHDASKVMVSHIATNIPESVYMMFQMTFAIITPALICGAFAERMKFSAMMMFMAVWSIVVYSPIAHWVWEPGGWLAGKGVLDFAGGTVVHINAGIAGLAAALVMGKRVGYGKEPMAPHNLVLTLVGASMLWVGWFGFNAGSAVAADGRAGMAMVVTQVATAAAALAWMFAEWVIKGKPSVLGIASGAVAGLVAITPASGFVDTTGALIIGIAAGVICFWAATSLKHILGYDDSLDAFGVHCVGGIVGALLTGVFNVKEISGVDGSLATQALGVGVTLVYGFVMSYIILKVIDLLIGLKVKEEEEREGLDLVLHGERVE
ncbi:MAG: ammonia channel protein [Ferrovum sp. 37-45-19]|uniref:ammonium transporter n=2 Tax=Ferrovum sp. JA12 TaxID=1356299 RepID=UPI0007025CBE|nr:ammonium transporter [Ferrovum sp. JA12]OYV79561.1 MAG: ammonia channel protein [Ferrovum sp. 21-44-67]OYV94644.1 MAG: ammonia channel protein [Ferrovum sp. 37-45-19]OZB34533.1 MAG: ammonia channel protein [Ferrovum sp. 34-44-207]HQT81481.1 ammonium transporter [Ferrovaceae bacterium]KRH79450.1 ammonia channel precursor [Ferrovum sp. JA12]